VSAINGFKQKCAEHGRDPAKVGLAHVVLWPVSFDAEKAVSGGRRTFTGSATEMMADAKALAASGIGHVNLSFHGPNVPAIVAWMERFAGEVMGKLA
jgi:hypothetical protein